MTDAHHCEHWYQGSDECHHCGHFPMMERLASMLGLGPEPVDPACLPPKGPCPDRVTWQDKLESEGAAP